MRSLKMRRAFACLGILFVLGGTLAPAAQAKSEKSGKVHTQGKKWR